MTKPIISDDDTLNAYMSKNMSKKKRSRKKKEDRNHVHLNLLYAVTLCTSSETKDEVCVSLIPHCYIAVRRIF